jgi:Asp-tRNA(Asn)/Glu-tRNA(Gln) amidotransferase A subunit family amidase
VSSIASKNEKAPLLQQRLEAVLARLERCEPQIQALLPEPGRRERLLGEAADLCARYPYPAEAPSLFGRLVVVKDIFNVDGFLTQAGSSLPPELFTGTEASCVTRLRRAGALVLGKSVTTEFAYFEPGPTRNPRNLEHTPGGSSSGSAAAVAAGYCDLALGSQTVGSVVRPAAFCGVAGFKFTQGRVPLDGTVPYAPSLDQFGFFAPAARDLPAVVQVYLEEPPSPAPTEVTLLVPVGAYLAQASPDGLRAFERQVAVLEKHGHRVLRVPVLNDIHEINHRHQRLAAAEMARVHQGWFEGYAERYRPRTARWIEAGRQVPDEEVAAALSARTSVRADLEAPLREFADSDRPAVWVSPAATGTAPRGLDRTGDPIMNLPWTYAGLPVAAVPAGLGEDGLPLGLQIAAACGQDSLLAAVAVTLAGAWEDA